MSEFHFNVKQGLITVRWNESRLLTGIEWQPDVALIRSGHFRITKNIPRNILDLIWLLNRYFESGTPVLSAQWGWPWTFVDQTHWSEFQKKVYCEVSQIPHGETRTYGWISWRMGNVQASRAVGQALRKNPVPILIPCHRVVASDSLGGFMGKKDPLQPELGLKTALLKLEDRFRQPEFPFVEAGAYT